MVGFGPHARRIYYKYIEEEVVLGTFQFEILIDIESKRDSIMDFLHNKVAQPKQILLCQEKSYLAPTKMDKQVKDVLDLAIKKGRIKYAIIATEPKAHKTYIEYFLSKHIPVLTDKPLTAPVGSSYKKRSARKIYTDALDLNKLSIETKTPLYVQAQRREHPAYVFLFNEIRKVVENFKIPITFFNIYHSDGTWSMPSEYLTRENHPYKYGYGKLLHSGYHYVDLVAQIAEINRSIIPSLTITNTTRLVQPHKHYHQINGVSLYKRLFGIQTTSPGKMNFGEVDAFSQFIFKDKERREITYGHTDLLQSGFSRRSHFEISNDTYKGNGRVRHEYLNINIGPLMNIQLHSYQADEIYKCPPIGVGSEDHLEVYIFRNDQLIGGKPFEIFDFGEELRAGFSKQESYIGQNEVARHIIFKQFLNNEPSRALIANQVLTNAILSSMLHSAITGRSAQSRI